MIDLEESRAGAASRTQRWFVLPGLLEELSFIATAGYPHEVCGALLGLRAERGFDVRRLLAGANIHADPRSGFELHPTAVVRAHREARSAGQELIGFFHSHPDRPALPSWADAQAAWDGSLQLITEVWGLGRTRTRAYLTQGHRFLRLS